MASLTALKNQNLIRPAGALADLPSGEPSAMASYVSTARIALRCELISDVRQLEELSSEWTRLWKSDSRAEIFQTPEWAIAWWRSFGRGSTLCSVVAFAADEIVGIVPLFKRDGVIQFLGTPEADYADIVCEDRWAAEVLAAAFKTLRESVTGWSECVLQHLAKHSRVMRHYRALPRQLLGGLHCVPRERYQTIIFADQRDAVFSSLLGKNHTRRRRNKLQKAGHVQFRHLETQPEAETYLNDFFRHHVRRHAVIGRRSAYGAPESRQFTRELVEKLGPAETVRFGVLELDGRPLAWHFGFLVNGKFLLYQHTFDLDASDYTPGELLLWNLFEYAKDHVAREFDFGKGDESYKSRFANHSRETFCLFVEPHRLAGRLRGLGRAFQGYLQPCFRQMKNIIKSRPAMLRAFRSLRMWTVGMTARFREVKADRLGLQYNLRLIAGVLRDFIWSKRSIVVFASGTLSGSAAETLVAAGAPSDVEVSAAGFGDLVDLAWQHPDVLLLTELSRCRERLKRGDQAYIARQKSRVVILCWVSNSTALANARAARSPSEKPEMIVDEFWNARAGDSSAAYRRLLPILIHAAGSKDVNILIHCGSDQPALRSELDRLGFRPRFQIIRRKFLSRFRRDSVLLPPPEATLLAAS